MRSGQESTSHKRTTRMSTNIITMSKTCADEKVTTEQQAKEEKEQAENIATMLMRRYDAKFHGEDDTSQPTSRAAPIIPMETTRKKKKRKR